MTKYSYFESTKMHSYTEINTLVRKIQAPSGTDGKRNGNRYRTPLSFYDIAIQKRAASRRSVTDSNDSNNNNHNHNI